jgi:uncharacterized membrane protein YeiB
MSGAARDGFVDEIRGLALLGIVLVSVPFFALSETGYTAASLATGWDRLAAFLTVAFAQAKFYLLFSFLFGYSLSYLLRSASSSSDDRARRARFRRRLLALGGFGALHAVFAFLGDILLLYAVLAVSMLGLVRWRDRSLLIFGVALLLGWLALLGALGGSLEALEPAGSVPVLSELDRALASERSAGLGALVGLPLALVSPARRRSASPTWRRSPCCAAAGRAPWPGRMSLTGYLGESVLLSLLFCGYGAGLYGQVGAAAAALRGIAIWCLLDLFARAWLARFEQGPLEAVMHRLIG